MRLFFLAFVFSTLTAMQASAGCGICSGKDKTTHIEFSAGIFDVIDDDEAASFNLEYQHHDKLIYDGLRPVAGLMATSNNATYAYVGARWELMIDDASRWMLAPNVAVGAYSQGDNETDLGHAIQFRTGIELGYVLDDNSRISLDFSHLSNAGIGDSNPGTEVLQLGYALPF